MNSIENLIKTMRLPFVILTPACVSVGVGTAYLQNNDLNWLHVLLIFIGAVSAHISVNAFNEYFDFKSGLDSITKRTPFSGGSGTLPENPEISKHVLSIGCASFAITAAIGLYFVLLQGWQLIPLGILGLFLLITYTIWWAYHPVLCLIAPGIGFGVLMVMGAHFALTGTYSLTAFIASLVPTFLVSDLLLLNQFPDVEADKSIGRRHFPITIGRRHSSILYGIMLALAYISVIIGIATGLLPIYSSIALLAAIISIRAFKGARQNAENIPALIPSMGMNVVVNISTPLLLTLGLFIG